MSQPRTGRRGALPFGVALVALAATLSASSAAAPLRAPGAARTLLTTSSPIASFAQDGRQIAWVTRQRAHAAKCRRILHLRSLATGRKSTLHTGCHQVPDLALAGERALWKTVPGGGNTELDLDVMTASAGQHRPSRVERLHMELDLESGFPNPDPPLAGAGSLLAYYAVQDPVVSGRSREHAVRRVVGRAARTVFAFDQPLALAVDGRRLAVVRQELGGDGCGCSASATWSPDGRRIAFLQGSANINSVEPAEIATANADGSGRAAITHDGFTRLDTSAALSGLDWSPDGSKIAYSYFKPAIGRMLAVVSPDGAGAHDLVSGEEPAWSPNGSAIAFSRYEDPAPHGIFVANADGTSVRQLTSGGEGRPAWSPDGTQIAYTSGGALFVVKVNGSGLHQIATMPAYAQEPDWSPNGHQIVFGSQLAYGGRGGLWVVNADGTGLRQLSSGGDAYPTWSPDGQRILFTSSRDDIVQSERLRLELYTMKSDGTGVHPLTFTRPAEWASVGEVHARSGRRLASFDAVGAPATTRYGSVAESRSVALGGSRVAVLSVPARSQGPRITLFDAHTGALRHVVPVHGPSPLALAGVSGRWVVFRTGRTIRALDASTLRTSTLAVARGGPIGLSVSGRRVAWAENACSCTGGRIRALTLPR